MSNRATALRSFGKKGVPAAKVNPNSRTTPDSERLAEEGAWSGGGKCETNASSKSYEREALPMDSIYVSHGVQISSKPRAEPRLDTQQQ
jgi:hypothetical protein